MNKFFGHLKTVIIHKWYVFRYCCKFGLIWRGLVHDMSKFSPIEFIESVKYYCGDVSPIKLCKEENEHSLAWQHHKGRNKHHYEYWIDDSRPIKMPLKYAMELCCDWMGAYRTYCHNQHKDWSYYDEYHWVMKKIINANMHQKTKDFVAIVFRNASIRNVWDKTILPSEY